MESESVVFGKWDNHGNDMNLSLVAQNSQKVGESVQLMFKHGNKHVRKVEEPSDLRYIIKYTLLRSVDEFNLTKAREAIELFNKQYNLEMPPMTVLEDWDLKRKIIRQQA